MISGCPGGGGFACEERPVRDDAGDGAADLGVAELRLGARGTCPCADSRVPCAFCIAALLLTFCSDSRCCLAMSYAACACTSVALAVSRSRPGIAPCVKSSVRALTMDWSRSSLALACARSSFALVRSSGTVALVAVS